MHNLAEYARRLHETERRACQRVLKPAGYRGRAETLRGVRAAIFDVYGTMVNYWRPGFEEQQSRDELLMKAFAEISSRFGMDKTLAKINPADAPEKTLNDFYNGLIALNRQKAVDTKLSEVRLDEVWTVILMVLKRNGYDVNAHAPESLLTLSTPVSVLTSTPTSVQTLPTSVRTSQTSAQTPTSTIIPEFARYLTYTYNFLAMGRELYPGVAAALKKLKDGNIALGILSDAQLYTPIDLTLLLRDQSGGSIDDYNEMFDPDLTFFSYEYGFVKPSEVLYRRLFDALYEYHILPSQTVFVGNDLSVDIKPAAALGMRTALFCGDDVMQFGVDGGVVPDVVFSEWGELPEFLSFHGEAG